MLPACNRCCMQPHRDILLHLLLRRNRHSDPNASRCSTHHFRLQVQVQGRDNLVPYRVMLPGESGGVLQVGHSIPALASRAWQQKRLPVAGHAG